MKDQTRLTVDLLKETQAAVMSAHFLHETIHVYVFAVIFSRMASVGSADCLIQSECCTVFRCCSRLDRRLISALSCSCSRESLHRYWNSELRRSSLRENDISAVTIWPICCSELISDQMNELSQYSSSANATLIFPMAKQCSSLILTGSTPMMPNVIYTTRNVS